MNEFNIIMSRAEINDMLTTIVGVRPVDIIQTHGVDNSGRTVADLWVKGDYKIEIDEQETTFAKASNVQRNIARSYNEREGFILFDNIVKLVNAFMIVDCVIVKDYRYPTATQKMVLERFGRHCAVFNE